MTLPTRGNFSRRSDAHALWEIDGGVPLGTLSAQMLINGHRWVGEHLVRIVENDLPSAAFMLQGLLESAVSKNVLDVRSPKYARPGRVHPMGMFVKKVCDPISSLRLIHRHGPMSPHYRVAGQSRNQRTGLR